jgi:hypothetical protein
MNPLKSNDPVPESRLKPGRDSSATDAPAAFRDTAELLRPLAQSPNGEASSPGADLAKRCLERLERDLLPRTAGAHEHLVAGIVGPNNAGKSLLFNSLSGHKLSPSEPRGGATRCLIGATSPALAKVLLDEPSLAQFPLVPISFDGAPKLVPEAGRNAEDPAELLLVSVQDFPPGVLLIDAPDFDSILTQNRAATESLMQVADLAVVVVTRHTYHNELVVRFLEDWLRNERPWVLVYNEAFVDESITTEHATALRDKLGSAPAAVFHAPFNLDLQSGIGELIPVALASATSVCEPGADLPAAGTPLAEWLFGKQRLRLKQQALASSAKSLSTDLKALEQVLRSEGALAARILETVAVPATVIGREVAALSMPPGPFLEAFRKVADRRIAPWRRHLRGGARKLRQSIEGLAGKRKSTPAEAISIRDLEARELGPRFGPMLEQLSTEFANHSSFWPGESAHKDLAAQLQRDLAQGAVATGASAFELAQDNALLSSFESVCEGLIEAELDSKGRKTGEYLVQFGVDLFHGLPIFAGIGTAIATGGVGSDVAALVAGGFGAAMSERFTKFLGTGVARSARARWQDLRGKEIATELTQRALPTLHNELTAQANERLALADSLSNLLKNLP